MNINIRENRERGGGDKSRIDNPETWQHLAQDTEQNILSNTEN